MGTSVSRLRVPLRISIAALLLTVTGCGGDDNAILDPSPGLGRVVFETDRDGDFELYILDADLGEAINITISPASNERQPDVSPDGSLVAFASDQDGNWDIYVSDLDGDSPQNLTDDVGGLNFTPAWSSDGNRIAWSRQSGGQIDVWVMNVDGTAKANLTASPEYDDAQPTWSPNDSLIAFQTNRDGNWEIYAVNADFSGNPVRLTNNPGMEFAPSWSPIDFNKIAFSAERDGVGDIWVADLALRTETNLTESDAAEFESDWSTDGSRLVFTRLVDRNAELYLANADGTSVLRLTFNPAADGQGAWIH